MLYLHEVLKPIINRIFDEKKYVELDPCKIDLNRLRQAYLKQVLFNLTILLFFSNMKLSRSLLLAFAS